MNERESNQGQPQGVIYDVGYRPYEGRTLGRAAALGALVWEDVKRALGVRKSWKYKVLIFAVLLIELGIFLFNLLVSQLTEAFRGPGMPATFLNPFSGFYESVSLPVLLLSALIVPELLVGDRRYRVYPLYLARPIHSYDYLLAKGIAAFGMLTLMTLGPALLLYLGKAFLAPDAAAYLGAHRRDLWALLASGPLIALFYASFALGVSSLTASRAYATGAIVGIVFLLSLVSGTLLFTLRAQWALLLDLGDLVLRVKDALFGTLSPLEIMRETVVRDGVVREEGVRIEPYSPWVYGAATLAVTALSWAVAWVSYRREAR